MSLCNEWMFSKSLWLSKCHTRSQWTFQTSHWDFFTGNLFRCIQWFKIILAFNHAHSILKACIIRKELIWVGEILRDRKRAIMLNIHKLLAWNKHYKSHQNSLLNCWCSMCAIKIMNISLPRSWGWGRPAATEWVSPGRVCLRSLLW